MLVNIHRKNVFKIVKAHTNLGENYLNAHYFQQALEHLTVAIKINNTLFSKYEETKHYHSHIFALLGRCYLEWGDVKGSLELLNQSIKLNKSLVGEEHISNLQLYTLIAQAYAHEKIKDYDKSLEYLNMVWEMAEKKYGKKNETLGSAYLEIAKVNMLKNDLSEAISNQKHAYEIFSSLETVDPNLITRILIVLSEWHEKANKFNEAIEYLIKADKIFEKVSEMNGNNNEKDIDKDKCKVQRNLSLLYMKNNEFDKTI